MLPFIYLAHILLLKSTFCGEIPNFVLLKNDLTIIHPTMTQDQWSTRVTLLEKIKNRHDEDAWEDFVHYYEQFIYNMLRHMRHSDSDAEELCQVILVKLWKCLPDFNYDRSTAKFRTWLCRVITNEVRDQVRRNATATKHRNAVIEEGKHNESLLFTESEVEKIAEEEWKKYVSNLAWKTVSTQISKKYADIFMLYMDGKTSEEIASHLDVKYNTVNTAKKRVKDRMIEEINRLTSTLL
ncbi:MAG: sigma-70 family RNA polymerase sigma factor [Planctomycetes bacterium]|nr:sigma-70 family RNA polymerase sigma factor [Planctomycetota bacterium]